MSLLVLTTGGTIGALPYEDPRKPPEFSSMPPAGRDFVREALETHFASVKTRCIALEPCDSKLMDESYRKEILSLIETAPEEAVLITHGTDALLNTADFFYALFRRNAVLGGKKIILTGSMTPLSNGAESDGYLNLAFSLDRLTQRASLPKGVNIVLCDFDKEGAWKPRLYAYAPDTYEKFYDLDCRYSRLRKRL